MQFAIVLLQRPMLPNADAMLEALRAIAPAVAAGVVAEPATDAARSTLGVSGIGELVAGLVEGEVPEGEAEAHARFSVSALGTGWAPQPHQAHAVVALKERADIPLSGLERMRLFTFLLAAVVEAAPAVGVYWGSARATHEPEFFVKVARDAEILPVMLWTGLSAASDGPGRVQLLSLAMDQLELPNLWLRAPAREAAESLDLFFDLLASTALRGSAPREGERLSIPTVGHGGELAVRHAPSPAEPEERVWSVTVA